MVLLSLHNDIDNQKLLSIKRLAKNTKKNYKLLYGITLYRELRECGGLNTSVSQDLLQEPPFPAWARAARWLGRGLALFFLVGLLALVGVLLSGAQDVLKDAVPPYLQSQPLALVAVALVGAAALVVLGEWFREKIVGRSR